MNPEVRPPTDLARVAATRRGLQLAAPGFLLVMMGSVPLAELGGAPSAISLAVRFAGWSLLALAMALWAPTPNGPLPVWLKPLYVLACAGAAARVAYHHWMLESAWIAWEQRYVRLLWLALLALPWILWRFCQHRGLTGRAITWLWCAMGLLFVFVVNWTTRTSWALWLCPPIGLILFFNARLTARDVWTDAIWKNARAAALAVEDPPGAAGPSHS